MKRPIAAALVALACIALAGFGSSAGAAPRGDAPPTFRVLSFSHTAGFRHFSIPKAHATIQELGIEHGFAVVPTEDPKAFTSPNLKRFDAVIFLLTTGDVLAQRQQRALKRYIRAGGGYVGIHSAADTEHDWPFYGKLVGAWFRSHPLHKQYAMFKNEAPNNPATAHLDPTFRVFDEFYSFKRNPREDVRVLFSIDERTYSPDPNTLILNGVLDTGAMGDHPMSWCHDKLGGRSFYTALGHQPYLYAEPWFRRHILAGIELAANQVRANCAPSPG